MSCEKDWVDIFSALLLPVVAILGSFIAYQQWKINKTRLQHELFDRKYLIFEATIEFIGAVMADVSVKNVDRYAFLQKTKGSQFIFNGSIVTYLEDLHKKSLQLKLYETKQEYEKSHEILIWFTEQLSSIDETFKNSIKVSL
jgi:DNA gyrase/topoisomerase IV subunit B